MRNRGIPRYLPREIARRRGATCILTHKAYDFLVVSRHTQTRSQNACFTPEGHPATQPEHPYCGKRPVDGTDGIPRHRRQRARSLLQANRYQARRAWRRTCTNSRQPTPRARHAGPWAQAREGIRLAAVRVGVRPAPCMTATWRRYLGLEPISRRTNDCSWPQWPTVPSSNWSRCARNNWLRFRARSRSIRVSRATPYLNLLFQYGREKYHRPAW